MAAFAGSDLKSTSLENALFEVAMKNQITESNSINAPKNKNAVQVTIDTDRKVAVINATLPIVLSVNATTGNPEFTVETYLD